LARRKKEPEPRFDKEAHTKVTREMRRSERPTVPPDFDLEAFAQEKLTRERERLAPPNTSTIPPPLKPPPLTAEPHSGTRARPPRRSTLQMARKRFETGDFASALTLAEGVAEDQPASPGARALVAECRSALEREYVGRLGSLERVARVTVSPEELPTLPLDHRAGFLLSHMDGVSTLEMVLDVCGMPRLEALRLIFAFVEEGIVRLE